MNREAWGHAVVLALDTATELTTVAAWSDRGVLAESQDEPAPGQRPRHAEVLLPLVEDVVETAGGWPLVGRIVVGRGPGTFTGLRIGLATAQALGAGTGAEVVGVSTLETLAKVAAPVGSRVVALVDARRGEVFAASYRVSEGAPEQLAGPLSCRPEQVIDALGVGAAGVRVVGSGAVKFREQLERAGFEVPQPADPVHRVSASSLAELGAGISDADAGPPRPIYLRPPDAQRWRERDARTSETGSRT